VGGYYVMDMNFIQTSHVKASIKQKMCRAEGRNYYLFTFIVQLVHTTLKKYSY